MMCLRYLCKAAALLGLVFSFSAAHADVWGYVDDKGNTHFANQKVDERYQLYFKTSNAATASAGRALPTSKVMTSSPSSLSFNAAADAAAGLKARRLVALINQSKAYERVRPTLQAEASRHGLDASLVKAIAAAESGFNPYAVSPVGAVGLMQIMPGTARMLGLKGDKDKSVEDKLTDPATNARLGVRYLSQLLRQFGGRTDLAVAAYNAGPGAVTKYKHRVPPYAETQGYVRTVLAIYETLQPGALGTAGTGASYLAAARTSKASGRRQQMVLAGSKRSPATALGTQVASITLQADAPMPGAPTALDTVAEKIAVADALAPALDKDVQVKPGKQAPAAP